MNALTIKQVREVLKKNFDRYAIRADGYIYVWGVMPNTDQYGCYLLADLASFRKNPEQYV